jgi:hypothetical protein
MIAAGMADGTSFLPVRLLQCEVTRLALRVDFECLLFGR